MKTFIRWPGNKYKYIKYILPLIPSEINTYIEPFVGSGAMLLSIQPNKWIINDKNSDLINLWKLVQKKPELLIEQMRIFNDSFKKLTKEQQLAYCRDATAKLATMKPSVHRTILWHILRYCAYMGIIMTKGRYYFYGLEGKLHYGKSLYFAKETYFDVVRKASAFLDDDSRERQGKIYNKDYKEILALAREGDFVFIDPPYLEDYDYHFDYNIEDKVDNNMLKNVYGEVKKLDAKGVKWMMTQADTKEVRKIFGSEYKIRSFTVYRMSTRNYKKELIITNY